METEIEMESGERALTRQVTFLNNDENGKAPTSGSMYRKQEAAKRRQRFPCQIMTCLYSCQSTYLPYPLSLYGSGTHNHQEICWVSQLAAALSVSK